MIEPDGRARCGYKWCGKLFKAPEFVKKHLRTKHESLAADVTIQCAKPYMWDRYCSECIYDRPLPSIPVETAYDVEYRTVKDILHRCSNAANIHTVVKINNISNNNSNNNTNNNNNQQKSHFNNRDRDRDRGDNRNDRGHTNNRDNNYNNRDSRNKSDRGGDRNNRRNSGTGTGSGTGSNNSNSITNTPNTNTNDNPNKRNLTSYTDVDAPQV